MAKHLQEDRFQDFFLILETNGGHVVKQVIEDLGQQLQGDAVLVLPPNQTHGLGDAEAEAVVFLAQAHKGLKVNFLKGLGSVVVEGQQQKLAVLILDKFEAAPEILVGGDEVVGEHALDGGDDGGVQFGSLAAEEDDQDQQVVGGLDAAVHFLGQEV